MKVRSAIMVIAAMLMLVPPLNDAPAEGVTDTIHPEDTRQDSSAAELVLDRVIEVPPGGETRLVLPNGSEPYLEGYIGPSEFTYGKLGQAAELLPDWMRDDFVRNMLKAGSYDLSVVRASSPNDPFRFNFIPTFGDLDGDGDEDMVVGLDGSLYFYKNVGGPGYPVFVQGGFECPDVISPDGTNWISPEICSIDGDPYGDIIYGDQTEFLHFLRNPAVEYGRWQEIALSVNAGSINEDHLSPTVIWYYKSYELYRIGIDGYELDLLIGCRNGRVNMWNVAIAYYDNGSAFTGVFGEGKMMNLMQTLNYSAPRSWPGQTNNSERQTDIVVGGGDGSLQMFAYAPGQLGTFNLVPNYFQNIDHQGPITPAPFDLDGDTSPDLVLGTRDTFLPEYINYHDDEMSPPYWAPSGTIIPPSPMENYLSVFDRRLKVYDESLIERYLDSIISPNDARYRDEIGFACAYTPPETLSGNRLANIFTDNAYYIYSRDSELEYVSLKEYGGDDYYTTASYWVDAGGTLKQMEIPMDAYYWGIVHPRITEEPVAYVDPESGGEELPENGGRFWREYIYEHADDSYPPGPEYPSDYTGRYVYYPKDFAPPLLKQELKGVEVLWDLQPYEYPAGFNDAGTEFNYPVGHKVHAIEKVSQWVETTLPLNQQESRDNERPNQPVRIAHHHNGNCGELQDLTVAAARCALIPARGINMPGEDHAWSEFYCGGWQQWDNYWSDGGGVVANDMTYWWGWGNRGGSGIYASMGTGEMVDVGERYRSPEVQGKLTVIVRSGNGIPVDGARVVLLSHWMMNNVNVDVGPYQGPPPVTVPFPSIWGYTDDTGTCTLTAWQQEFNLKVTSEMGQYYSEKFMITSDDQTMEVDLQGNMPIYSSGMADIGPPESGSKYLISAEILGSYQDQTQFLTGEHYRETSDISNLIVELNMNDGNTHPSSIFTSFISERSPLMLPLESGVLGSILKIKKWGGIKTSTLVRLKVFQVMDISDYGETNVIVSNPTGKGDRGLLNGHEVNFDNHLDVKPETLLGWIINPRSNITNGEYIAITDDGNEFVLHEYYSYPWNPEYWNYEWVVSWGHANLVSNLDAGTQSLLFEERSGETNRRSIARSDILVNDIDRPSWEGSSWQRSYPWGSDLNFNADLDDPQSVSGFGWLDSKLLWTAGPADKHSDQVISGSVDSSKFSPGGHQLRLSVLDSSDNLRTMTFPTSFVPGPPLLNITSPAPGYGLADDQLVVRAQASDDVELTSLTADVNGTRWDLFRYLDSNGFLETVLDLDEVPGALTLVMTATDNVGLTTQTSVNFTIIAPPDTTPPIIEITDPSSGKRITIGDMLTVRGRALDDTSLSQLKLQSPDGIEDILPQLKGSTWSVQLDTASWPEGSVLISVRGVDPKGNIGSDQVTVTAVLDLSPFRDRTDPVISISSPGANDPVELGTVITLQGSVEDDGTIERFEISMDRGENFDDMTSTLGDDGSFSVRIDTALLPRLLSLEPVKAKDVLGDYRLYLMAQDSAGKVTYLDRRLELRDTKAPDARFERFDDEISEGTNMVSMDLVIKDGSAPGPATISIMNNKGRTVSVWEVPQKDFVLSNGEWKASTYRSIDLGPGEYEVKAVVRDVYGNTASISQNLVVEKGPEARTIPIWFYLTAGGGALLLLLLLFLSVSLILSKMEKRQKKSSPDAEQPTKD